MDEELKKLKLKIDNMQGDIDDFESQGMFNEANAIRETLELLREQYNVLKAENDNTE